MTKPEGKNQSTESNGISIADDASIAEVSLEALEEITIEIERACAATGRIKTQQTDGSTLDPHEAMDQGLVYTPPSDPPILPSDDPQGAKVGAGFAISMEESNPDVEQLPERVANNDLDLEEDIVTALRINSETGHLHNIKLQVHEGVVRLWGSVFSEEDIAIVEHLIRDLDGVVEVVNHLQLASVPSAEGKDIS